MPRRRGLAAAGIGLPRLRVLTGRRWPTTGTWAAPAKESEMRALDAFGRLLHSTLRNRRTGQDRRKRDRRHRAVLVETDRRSGFDRRGWAST